MRKSYFRVGVAIAVAALSGVFVVPTAAVASEAATVVHTGGSSLNVRSGPTVEHRIVDAVNDGSAVSPVCQVRGEHISGAVSSTSTWIALGPKRWISGAFLKRGENPVPWCSGGEPRATEATVHTPGSYLNVRPAANVKRGPVDRVANGATVDVECQTWGESIFDDHVWLRLSDQRFISGFYVRWSDGAAWLPWCGQEAPSIPKGGNAGFLETHAPAAQKSQDDTGVPASVTLAQAVLESAWGHGALAREDHNFFGMKCFGSPGDLALGCRDYGTFECTPTGKCSDVEATFRAYRSPADSYRDHGELLSTWSRYADAMAVRDDPRQFARQLQKAGYATDPKYADKLIDIMDGYDLYQYD